MSAGSARDLSPHCSAPRPDRGARRAVDALLLYVAGDNDLSAFAQHDVAELQALAVSQFIQIDGRYAGWADRAPNSYRICRRGPDEARALLPEELNTGDVDALRSFLHWCADGGARFERSLLVLWGHGEGWLGCCKDFLDRDRLDLSELQQAFAGYRFGAVGFDACIMASLEVAHALAPHTSWMLASQEIEPKTGWDYRHLDAAGAAVPAVLATMANQYVDQATEEPLCLSLLQLDDLPHLLARLDAIFEECLEHTAAFREAAEGIPRIANDEYVDLCTLLQTLADRLEPLRPQAAELIRAVETTMVVCNYTNRAGYRGISLWLPRAARPYKRQAYASLAFAQTCPAFTRVLERYVRDKN